MPKPEGLKNVYIDELKDLWSANDQMARALKLVTPKASDAELKSMLKKSQDGIKGHTALLKSLLKSNKESVRKEHCKGMEGLCTEAIKHVIEEGPDKGAVLDAIIIAQYQRMTHYGIAGFGTVAAFAKQLKLTGDAKQLREATKAIYGSDEYMTKLAEVSVNAAADE